MRLIYENAHPNGLPEGFVELDFIQSDGRQYIQTELVPDAFTGADVVFETTTRNYVAYAVFGSRAAIGRKAFSMYTSYYEGVYVQFGSYNERFEDAATNILTPYRYRGGRDGWFLDGRELVGRIKGQFRGTLPIALFTVNEPTGPDSRILVGRMRRASFTHRGVSAANFVPCRRVADGAVGMFETVGGRFYGNSGSGTFTAGTEMRYCRGVASSGTCATTLDVQLSPDRRMDARISVPETPATVIALTAGAAWVAFRGGKVGTNKDGASISFSSSTVYEPDVPFTLSFRDGAISVNGAEVMVNTIAKGAESKPVLFDSGVCTLYRCGVYDAETGESVREFRTVNDGHGYGYLVDGTYHVMKGADRGQKLSPGKDLAPWKLRIPYHIGKSTRKSGFRTVWCESVPSEIRPLRYIEFDGRGYVDLKYAANTTRTVCSIDLSFTEAPSSATTWWGIAGTRNTESSGPSSMNLMYSRDDIRADWSKGESWIPRIGLVDAGVRHRIELSRGMFRFDGEPVVVEPSSTESIDAEFGFLVGTFTQGKDTSFLPGMKGRVYRVSISEAGELKRNFVPAYHRRLDKYGLWDFRKGCFFEGSGDGIIAGK